MEMWFAMNTWTVKLAIRVDYQCLYSDETENRHFVCYLGKILVVDGDLMLTEKDEFIYHEMIGHVPMVICIRKWKRYL